MNNYKVYKTDENGENPTHQSGLDYTDNSPRDASQMNAADAYGAQNTLHLALSDSYDPRYYGPSKVKAAFHEGVQYYADAEGQGAITLEFDGSKSIATVVSEWNTNNSGNTVSHSAQDDTVVPSQATVELTGDGEWKLVYSPTKYDSVQQQLAKEQKEANIAAKSRKRQFGLKMIDLISHKNDANGITETQLLNFMQMQTVKDIKSLLESGSLNTAKNQLNNLGSTFFDDSNVVITASDRDELVSDIEDFLNS